jgi:hypothetical protein
MFDAQTSHAIGLAINKLVGQLVTKEDELRLCEQSQGKAHDVRKMNKLREEIASLERRISLAESVQDRMTF